MILALADQVCAQLDRANRLETMRNQAQAMQLTHDALLKNLQPAVARFTSAYAPLRERIPLVTLQPVRDQAARIAQEVRAIHLAFETQPKQETAITKVKQSLDVITSSLQAAWAQHAGAQMSSSLELFGLLYGLPEIREQAGTLTALKTRLVERGQCLPTSSADLAGFDQDLMTLHERLGRVEGLNPAVMGFLRSVLAGTATVADLTDEVLIWCRREENGRALHVTF